MGVFSYLLTRPDSRYITRSSTSELTLHQDLEAKRYDVQECALRVVYLVNLKFKDRFLIDESADIHIAIHVAIHRCTSAGCIL